jgi:Cell division protein CrgA
VTDRFAYHCRVMAPPKRKGGRTLPATPSAAGASSSGAGTGRVTKKSTTSSASATDDRAHHASDSSSRYTPPVYKAMKMSPPWLPWLMGAFLVSGALLIVINYLGTFWDTSNWMLLGGLAAILAGIITATQWR